MHLNSYLLFRQYALDIFKPHHKVMEIGATGPSPYHRLVNPKNDQWFTLNLAGNPAIDGWKNHIETEHAYSFPVESNSFDVVVSGQVIEHVEDIFAWMEELYRVTKPGGYVITINPVSWPFHEAPVDCWRIYPDGMKALTKRMGFKLILSKFECLELRHFGYSDELFGIANFTIPDVSIADDDFKIYKINPVKIRLNKVLKNIPGIRALMSPVKVAYDTITIVQKPE